MGRSESNLFLNGVNLIGFCQSESGLGQAMRNVHRSIQACNIPCTVMSLNDPNMKQGKHHDDSFSQSHSYKVNLININADQSINHFIRHDHQILLNRYNIGYFNWELETFPDCWLDSFFFYDEIWAPSSFTQKSIQTRSPIPVLLMPYSISISQLPGHLDRGYFGLDPNAYVFLFVFDCNSIVSRKNPAAVIQAFQRAFGTQHDVILVIKMMNGATHHAHIENLKELSKEQSNIRLIDQLWERQISNALMQACDVFVSLHRSEGFGLNLCEAMAMSKPVIATHYSANVDYMNDSNAYLVDFHKVKLRNKYGPYLIGEVWAEPDVEHAARLMKHVYENRTEARLKGLKAQETIQAGYSDEVIGQKIFSRLQWIFAQGIKKNKMGFTIDKSQLNLMSDSLASNPSSTGVFLKPLRKFAKWVINPFIVKQTRINHLQNIRLDNALKKIENLEREIKALKEK